MEDGAGGGMTQRPVVVGLAGAAGRGRASYEQLERVPSGAVVMEPEGT